jgi:hypothetical protein
MPALSPRIIRRHFRRADAATTNEEKGRALEDLA